MSLLRSGGSSAAFIGRHQELQVLAETWREAAAGHPWVVTVEGAPGAGKSALVRRFVEGLDEDVRVVRVQGDDLATDIPMGLLLQVVDVAAVPPFTAGLELLAFLGDLQQAGPVCVVVEDLHWADEPSRQALVTALRRLERDRVLVVITLRDDGAMVDERWERLRLDTDRCRRIDLAPFGPRECAELAETEGKPLDSHSAERLAAHTGGNPLYVRALLGELSAEELTSPDGALPVPRSLASVIVAQVANLPAPAGALLEALAVLGGPTSAHRLGVVAGVDDPLDVLVAARPTSLVEWHNDPTATVAFVHPLLQAAVVGDLAPRRRRELHTAAARSSTGDDALRHRVAAADPADTALPADLRAAATEAQATGQPAVAATDLLRLADLPGVDPDERDQAALDAALVLLEAGQFAAARALRSRLEAASDSQRRGLVLGLMAAQSGDSVVGEQLLRGARIGPDPALAAKALVQLAYLYTAQVRGADAVEAARQVEALDGAPDFEREIATVLGAIGLSQTAGARRGLDELDQRFHTTGEPTTPLDALVLGTRGMFETYAGRFGAAERSLRGFIDASHRGLQTVHLARVEAILAYVLVALGRWDEAGVRARTAVSLATDEGQVLVLAQAHAAAAAVAAGRGQVDEADRHIERSREAADRSRTVDADTWARIAAASGAHARSDHQGVVDALLPLEDAPDDRGAPMFAAWWMPRLVSALVSLDALDEARARLAVLDRLVAQRDVDLGLAISLLRARLVPGGRTGAAERTRWFETAEAAITPDSPVLETAELHHRYGRHLLAMGDLRRAREHLGRAERALRELGATPYLEAVRTDLALAGAEPAPVGDDRMASLTERERDVVALVRQGRTNKEVAAALFVSTKAIEYHLGNVFAKLHIRSRRELDDALAR